MSLNFSRAVSPLGVDRDIRVEAHWNPGDETAALAELADLYETVRAGIEGRMGRRPCICDVADWVTVDGRERHVVREP